MVCKNCLVQQLQFEIMVSTPECHEWVQLITSHLKRRGFSVNQQGDILTIDEPAARELVDFCAHFMQTSNIYYRFNDFDWEPIQTLQKVLSTQWIDDVLHRNAIVSYSQPIVNRHEEIFGYEILSRFTREDGSLIYPNEIFSAARSRGRLYALDRLCRMAAVRYAAQLNKKVFINFIPTSIYSPEFCLQSTIRLANQLKINPKQFVFEVVESEQITDIQHLKNILNYYNEKGFQYALDDVGEGYNTIELLGDIEPHYMKLDMKYVQGVSTDSEKQAMAKQYLNKALEINAIPLAEGIESRADFEWLKSHGYELFQGYLFGKPSLKPQLTIAI